MDSDYSTLRQAIQERLVVTCDYDNRSRELYPLLLGKKDGERKFFGWQFGGRKTKGTLAPGGEWKCFFVSKMRNVSTRKEEWEKTYFPGTGEQTCMDEIDVRH